MLLPTVVVLIVTWCPHSFPCMRERGLDTGDRTLAAHQNAFDLPCVIVRIAFVSPHKCVIWTMARTPHLSRVSRMDAVAEWQCWVAPLSGVASYRNAGRERDGHAMGSFLRP